MGSNLFLENKKLNTKEIKEKKSLLLSKPTSIICTLTNRCNLQCVMCGTWKDTWEIPEKTFDEIISLLPYLEHAIWLGGEVFLSKHFGRVLDETKKYPNLAQRINTNGLLITEEWAEKLLKNNVELIYSIDSTEKETYEYIRKGAHFEDLLKSIKTINKMKEKYENKNFSLRMCTVIMKSTYREIEKYIDFAKEHGFSAVHLMPIIGDGGTPEHIFSSKVDNTKILKQLDDIRERLQEKANKYNIELLNSLPSLCDSPKESPEETPDGNLLCYLPWQQLIIYPGGDIKFGCFCPKSVGNILKNSIEEIWNSTKIQGYRKKIATGNYQDLCISSCIKGEISRKLRMVGEVPL